MNELVIVNYYGGGYYQIYNKKGQLYENRNKDHAFRAIPHADKNSYLEVDYTSETMKKISLDHPHKLANTISSLDIVALSNIHGSPGRVVVICKEGQFGFIDLASE